MLSDKAYLISVEFGSSLTSHSSKGCTGVNQDIFKIRMIIKHVG